MLTILIIYRVNTNLSDGSMATQMIMHFKRIPISVHGQVLLPRQSRYCIFNESLIPRESLTFCLSFSPYFPRILLLNSMC